MINQKAYVMVLVLVVFSLLIGLLIFPIKFPRPLKTEQSSDNGYCRDIISGESKIMTVPSTGIKYKLVKQNVPVLDHYNDTVYNHYGSIENYLDPETGKKYTIRDLSKGSGTSYQFASDVDPSRPYDLAFGDYGIIMLFPADDNYQPLETGLTAPTFGGSREPMLLADVYKQVDKPELPDWVLKCQDYPTNRDTEQLMIPGQNVSTQEVISPTKVVIPKQQISDKKDQLQLEWFLFERSKFLIHNWWTPHCKPAVYLYPKQKQLVNVRVYPKGELGYTDPPYDLEKGWTVNADSDGKLLTLDDKYIDKGYLYYESKIRDQEIKKPTQGWVVKYEELASFYSKTLPILGLNNKESKDFSDYWLKTLPKSPYYFVGLVDKSQRDYLEKLDVTPAPDVSIRFSLYFEPLEKSIKVEEPKIITPQRKGFTLVDWGGMVKLHPGTPFTCSQ